MFKSLLLILFFVFNVSTNNRIINGDVVDIKDHPYVVSIRFIDKHICGGAIINERTIVTSAQCVFDLTTKPKPKHVSIRAGSAEHAKGQMIAGNGIPVTIPSYKREYHENDIGIIKLAKKLQFGDTIQPISLPDKDFVLPENAEASFVGWGITAGGNEISDTLRNSTVSILSYLECNKAYGTNMIDTKMMCGSSDQQEFCRGDLGGPLVFNNTLIGVASWIYKCDTSTFPGVYTNVSYHLTFINKNSKK